MYLVLFIVGLGFIVVSMLLDTFVDIEGGPMAILQPKLIAVFIMVMGGIGLILSARLDSFFAAPIIFILSALSGIIIAGLLNRLVIIPLHKAQNTSAHDRQATIGTTAKIISPIPQNGYGKIRYSVSGSVVTSPAKSEDGGEIRNGESVDIIYIEGGTYFVRRKENAN